MLIQIENERYQVFTTQHKLYSIQLKAIVDGLQELTRNTDMQLDT